MDFVYNDGGRSKYFKGHCGDCVTRSIAIATGIDYKKVYDDINSLEDTMRVGKHEKKGSARGGVRKKVYSYYIEKVLGWVWHPTMFVGQGCKVHLSKDELPSGTIIVSVSGHNTTVIDGVINDTYDCSRDENRCVYGYWTQPTKESLETIKQVEEEKANKEKAKEEKKKLMAQFKAEEKKIKEKYKPYISKAKKVLKGFEKNEAKEIEDLRKRLGL